MSGSGITKKRPDYEKVADIKYIKTNRLATLEEGFCSAFRLEDQEIDPINEVLCFSTGIRLDPKSKYRIRFLNNHSILKSGYQILDVAEPSAENVYAIKFREGADISTPFSVPYVIERHYQRSNLTETFNAKNDDRRNDREEPRPSSSYHTQGGLSRWG